MKVSFLVTPIKCLEIKTGEGQNGQWKKGKWLFSIPNTEEQLVSEAFNTNHDKIEKSLGQSIQVDLDIKAREWDGKYYNNINVSMVYIEETNDIPTTQTEPVQNNTGSYTPPSVNTTNNIVPKVSDDLPFN